MASSAATTSTGLTARTWASLVLLAFAAFAYNTSESFPVGLLPQISDDLGASEPAVGRLLTLYAVVVAVTVMPLVALLSGTSRKRLTVVTVGTLAASNAAMALAPTYETLLGARLISATTHGIFWSIVAPTAAMLVARGREGFATAIAFTGSSLAMVAGTPITTALGVAFGWRTSSSILASVAAVACIGLLLTLPPLEVDRGGAAPDLRRTLQLVTSTLRNRALLALCALTILVVTAYFATYTYVSLILDRFAGVRDSGLAVVLLVYGAAGLVGVWLVGRASDRAPRTAALVCMGALGASLLGIGVFASWAPWAVVVCVVALGAAFAATPVFLQTAVLRVAPEASDVASSLYVVAFQIGIASGSLSGGLGVDAGGLTLIPIIAAALVIVGMAVFRGALPRATPAAT